MKKVAWLIIILACFSAFTPDSAYAQSGLELWCLANGQTWDPATSICTVYGEAAVNNNITINFT